MGIPFHNGPNRCRDVFVPLDFITGGREMAGGASAQLAARVVGAYGTVREQFDTPIRRCAGFEEPLARMGGSPTR